MVNFWLGAACTGLFNTIHNDYLPFSQILIMQITIRTNTALAQRVGQVKLDTGNLTISRGFKSWLKYIKKESYKLYIDNNSRL